MNTYGPEDLRFFDHLKRDMVGKIHRRLRIVSDFEQANGYTNIDPDSIQWSFDYVVMDETVIDDGMVRQVVKFIAHSKDVWFSDERFVYLAPKIVDSLPEIMKEI